VYNTSTAHVFVRKHNVSSEYIITAWAADGIERDVTIAIPELGEVTVFASARGTIYRTMDGVALTLLDENGQDVDTNLPSLQIVSQPGNLGYVAVKRDGTIDSLSFQG
jgi:hypothetical protein